MKTYKDIEKKITNIRYGPPGKVLYDFGEHTISLCEPGIILLVGWPGAARWLAVRYGRALSLLK